MNGAYVFSVRRQLLATAVLLASCALPLEALAVDSDGDGVDDSLDAFPTYPEATTDTDADGMPDTVDNSKAPVVFLDTFDISLPGWSQTTYNGSNGWNLNAGRLRATGGAETNTIYRNFTLPSSGGYLTYKHQKGTTYSVSASMTYGPVYRSLFTAATEQTESAVLPPGTNTLSFKSYCWAIFITIYCGFLDDVTIRSSSLTLDPDDDNDGVPDSTDACPRDASASTGNHDADTLCDLNDPDDDNDGVPDYLDPEPLNAANSSVWPLDGTYKGSALNESVRVQ